MESGNELPVECQFPSEGIMKPSSVMKESVGHDERIKHEESATKVVPHKLPASQFTGIVPYEPTSESSEDQLGAVLATGTNHIEQLREQLELVRSAVPAAMQSHPETSAALQKIRSSISRALTLLECLQKKQPGSNIPTSPIYKGNNGRADSIKRNGKAEHSRSPNPVGCSSPRACINQHNHLQGSAEKQVLGISQCNLNIIQATEGASVHKATPLRKPRRATVPVLGIKINCTRFKHPTLQSKVVSIQLSNKQEEQQPANIEAMYITPRKCTTQRQNLHPTQPTTKFPLEQSLPVSADDTISQPKPIQQQPTGFRQPAKTSGDGRKLLRPYCWTVQTVVQLINIFWSKMKQHGLQNKAECSQLQQVRDLTVRLQDWFNSEIREFNSDQDRPFTHRFISKTVREYLRPLTSSIRRLMES